MSERTRNILIAIIRVATIIGVAIWAAILFILASSAGASPFHHGARQKYVRQVYKELASYAIILGDYQAHPPDDSTEQEDSMYVTRGECDIVIVEERVQRYAHGDIAKEAVEEALKNLARDIEDTPVPMEHRWRRACYRPEPCTD